jgi:hypothetical protein
MKTKKQVVGSIIPSFVDICIKEGTFELSADIVHHLAWCENQKPGSSQAVKEHLRSLLA